MIYLDNAATTYPKPENVYKALDEANRNAFNTGRGSYKSANQASLMKENVRKKILNLNNIKKGNVIFSNSATRALNDIIFGISEIKTGDYIYISPFEHNSIVRPLNELKKRKNINIEIIPFKKDTWELDEDKLVNMFAIHNPKAIFLSQVSNVTGYILPYNKIFNLGNKYSSINVLDAAQGYGIVKINDISNINYIVFAGHKSLYGSFGIAGFIKLKDDILDNNIFGGTGSDTMNPNMPNEIPFKYEAGSPNIVAIASLNESIDWLSKINIYEKEKELTNYLIEKLKTVKNIKIFVPNDIENIISVVSIGINNYTSEDVGRILDDEYDICVRTGYHCSPFVHEFINSLDYMGTVRISLNYYNSKEDIDALIEALKSL